MVESILSSLLFKIFMWAVGLISAAFMSWISYQKFLKKDSAMKDDENKLEEANKISDDEQRLKEKSDAAGDIERSLGGDPSSHS